MKTIDEIRIPPMSARALRVGAGQIVRIIDVEGGQPGDFVAFKADDLSIKFSQARTRVENRTVRVTRGHSLWTNTFPPEIMFAITADTCGAHDLLYAPCCRYALEKRFNVCRDGCLENLVEACKPWGLDPRDIPDPLNVFFDVRVTAAGGTEIAKPPSRAGDFVDLEAKMECLVAVSTCAVPLPDKENSSYKVILFES